MGLPSPTYSFTIPSVHDDISLACRLYHPPNLTPEGILKGAIVAHPYAPLGGSYDDPVVDLIGGQLLRAGYIVGTFNFRGAGESSGRTSWTAKPELADYISFYGFMTFYMHVLRPKKAQSSLRQAMDVSGNESVALPSLMEADNNSIGISPQTRLILAGYSYGSMVAMHLPTFHSIVDIFTFPKAGSPEAEIQLRASRLASQRVKELTSMRQSRGRSLRVSDALRHDESHSVAMGGDESEAGSRRVSRDSRRSLDFEGIRQSLDRSRKRIGIHRQISSNEDVQAVQVNDLQQPEICYLLISPLLPPVAMFATMFSKIAFTGSVKPASTTNTRTLTTGSRSELVAHQALAVYGDKDFFTSQKKLRKWAEQLYREPESRFRFVEIDQAGHFWHEAGTAARMKSTVSTWVNSLE